MDLAKNDVSVLTNFGKLFADGVKEAKALVKTAAADAEKAAAERAAEREAFIARLMDDVNGLGLDLDTAATAADAAMAKKYGAPETEKAPKYKFVRVPVLVDGKEYQIPTSGNMVSALKEAVEKSGLSRKDFILANAVDKAAAEKAFEESAE